jgi:hypothetical protein
MRVEASQEIARPVAEVFRFFAREHVRNHPRWDPDIELEATSTAPLAVGSVIRRRNNRSGTPVAGTMEVVVYEPERAFATVIREGPVEVRGGALFEPIGADRTKLTITTDVPDDPRWDPSLIASRMQRSVATIKDLIEAEPQQPPHR